MARRRLAVVLLVPQPLATEVDGLRRACGDPRRGRIDPHITLVPPVNLREDDLASALTTCRHAAAAALVLHLALDAPSTFAPETPLAWLSVAGDVAALADLRSSLDVGPLARPTEWPFVPHVTISGQVDRPRLDAMLAGLGDFSAPMTVDRLHVLENRQLGDGRWGWLPVEDVRFGRSAVVGAGGLALELAVGQVLDPEAASLLRVDLERAGRPLIVTARRDATVVGVAIGAVDGSLGRLDTLVVADGHRHQGVGSHLLARFAAEAAEQDCTTLAHVAASADGVSQLCRRRGWTAARSEPASDPVTLIRRLTI